MHYSDYMLRRFFKYNFRLADNSMIESLVSNKIKLYLMRLLICLTGSEELNKRKSLRYIFSGYMKNYKWIGSFIFLANLLPNIATAQDYRTISCEAESSNGVLRISFDEQKLLSVTSSGKTVDSVYSEAIKSVKYLGSYGDGAPFVGTYSRAIGQDQMMIRTTKSTYKFVWNRAFSGSKLLVVNSNDEKTKANINGGSVYSCWHNDIDVINNIFKNIATSQQK